MLLWKILVGLYFMLDTEVLDIDSWIYIEVLDIDSWVLVLVEIDGCALK
jgi:hypothetical protein